MLYGFIPVDFLGGAWRDDALRSWLSPLASAFLSRDFISAIFNMVFLLIAGRYVEKAIRPVGLGVVFVAGAYAGALARLILTSGSPIPSAGLDAAVFAVIGAYFMLYGVPAAIPVARHHSRTAQIAILAGIWLAIQIAFAIVAQNFAVSVTIVEPIGGLIAGVALARPLLAWVYRKA
ncbi:rhomboid family intramembrane serine protease [Sphingomonas sp. QA11]|uniref:rhomboid family intramembrane serine protease n=1 Tax=Sphingomonas sp. QA11 TaxID=2950605 RepID=UPI00234A7EA8|nr:rhomboid family intramembrane serine protease [Sphingomonas sp. QA11]WCM28332.1 rhomboid family intramembrane serine protease [Sphingomonas sp. QA11]